MTAISTLHNEGPDPVTIIAITPIDPRNARIEATDLVSMPTIADTDGTFIIVPGFGAGYPPTEGFETPAAAELWAERRPAVGSVISPDTTWTLAYAISAERAGSIQGLAIDYESSDGQAHRTRTDLAVELRSHCIGRHAVNA